ncbi:acyl carrier protein [Streptacidiphilus jiangxiensis]|uniref:Nonribosomal peptide synthetase MxcG n=1 Tax=Streptacidiphilus jiangxiensis TaxID=235985 RepID=A0A1H7RCM3_STRJI|nr:acyl carrier protein [Streptacidiphilus jiangxiensis]SEL58090.1 nonribosomal peptide synthetase MxcG [Streptacidiphilus jiangxiensis]
MTVTTASGTSTVELVVAVYQDALGVTGLDQESDFFEHGGDSLTAFQITSRLQDALGAEIPVALVFAYPSPVELAEVLEADFGQA